MPAAIRKTRTLQSNLESRREDKVTLREYLEMLLVKHEELNSAYFTALDARMAAADKSLTVRLESLNELRRQVTDDRAQFVKLETYEVQHLRWKRALTRPPRN